MASSIIVIVGTMHAPAAESKEEPFHSGKTWSVAALMVRAPLAVSPEGIRVKGQQELVAFDKVAAAYSKATPLALTQKIKKDDKVYENGSRQTIGAIDGVR
jgi:hypothetical protein